MKNEIPNKEEGNKSDKMAFYSAVFLVVSLILGVIILILKVIGLF